MARYLSPVCPDCEQIPTGETAHGTIHGMVAIGCRDHLVVDPNLLGIEVPNWLDAPRPAAGDRFRVIAPVTLGREELAVLLAETFAARGGDEPEPFPDLDVAALRETVRSRTQMCGQGWHTPYYEADNWDEAMAWAQSQVGRLLPDVFIRPSGRTA